MKCRKGFEGCGCPITYCKGDFSTPKLTACKCHPSTVPPDFAFGCPVHDTAVRQVPSRAKLTAAQRAFLRSLAILDTIDDGKIALAEEKRTASSLESRRLVVSTVRGSWRKYRLTPAGRVAVEDTNG